MPICTEEDIRYCFRLLLGREPSPEEWKGHKLLAGNKLDAVVSTYINSLEFKNRKMQTITKPLLVEFPEFKIYVHPDDLNISVAIALIKSYEPHVTSVMKRLIISGMTFLDVGANVGYFSLLAASMGAKVIAVEPSINDVKLLYLSAALNGFEIEIYPFAAMHRHGLISFASDIVKFTECDLQDILQCDLVFAEKLDNLVEKADVIKIDVEGADYLAMKGALRLLESKPIVFAEFAPPALGCISRVSGEDYLRLFLDYGYDISVITFEGEVIDCQRDINKIIKIYNDLKVDHIDILFSPGS